MGLYVDDVCKRGMGPETCRYLTLSSDHSGMKWACVKLTNMKAVLDARGTDMTAQGDNCDGVSSAVSVRQDTEIIREVQREVQT